MTVVIYKEHRIEIEPNGPGYSYSVWDEDGYLVGYEIYVEFSKTKVIEECKWTVDDYLKNPEEY